MYVSTSFLSKNLFNKKVLDVNCELNKMKIKTVALLNIDNSKIAFIDTKFAQNICDKLDISFQRLIKVKLIREYNEKNRHFDYTRYLFYHDC